MANNQWPMEEPASEFGAYANHPSHGMDSPQQPAVAGLVVASEMRGPSPAALYNRFTDLEASPGKNLAWQPSSLRPDHDLESHPRLSTLPHHSDESNASCGNDDMIPLDGHHGATSKHQNNSSSMVHQPACMAALKQGCPGGTPFKNNNLHTYSSLPVPLQQHGAPKQHDLAHTMRQGQAVAHDATVHLPTARPADHPDWAAAPVNVGQSPNTLQHIARTQSDGTWGAHDQQMAHMMGQANAKAPSHANNGTGADLDDLEQLLQAAVDNYEDEMSTWVHGQYNLGEAMGGATCLDKAPLHDASAHDAYASLSSDGPGGSNVRTNMVGSLGNLSVDSAGHSNESAARPGTAPGLAGHDALCMSGSPHNLEGGDATTPPDRPIPVPANLYPAGYNAMEASPTSSLLHSLAHDDLGGDNNSPMTQMAGMIPMNSNLPNPLVEMPVCSSTHMGKLSNSSRTCVQHPSPPVTMTSEPVHAAGSPVSVPAPMDNLLLPCQPIVMQAGMHCDDMTPTSLEAQSHGALTRANPRRRVSTATTSGVSKAGINKPSPTAKCSQTTKTAAASKGSKQSARTADKAPPTSGYTTSTRAASHALAGSSPKRTRVQSHMLGSSSPALPMPPPAIPNPLGGPSIGASTLLPSNLDPNLLKGGLRGLLGNEEQLDAYMNLVASMDPKEGKKALDLLTTVPSSSSARKARRGGGRCTLADPRLDPEIDPKKARRIFANRMSAARSKLRQRLIAERVEQERQELERTKTDIQDVIQSLKEKVASLEAENQALRSRLGFLESGQPASATHSKQQAAGSDVFSMQPNNEVGQKCPRAMPASEQPLPLGSLASAPSGQWPMQGYPVEIPIIPGHVQHMTPNSAKTTGQQMMGPGGLDIEPGHFHDADLSRNHNQPRLLPSAVAPHTPPVLMQSFTPPVGHTDGSYLIMQSVTQQPMQAQPIMHVRCDSQQPAWVQLGGLPGQHGEVPVVMLHPGAKGMHEVGHSYIHNPSHVPVVQSWDLTEDHDMLRDLVDGDARGDRAVLLMGGAGLAQTINQQHSSSNSTSMAHGMGAMHTGMPIHGSIE